MSSKIEINRAKLFATMFILVLAGSILGYVSATGTMPTITTGVFPGAPSYTVWVEGSTYYAKNAFGAIEFSSTNASQVLNDAIDSGRFIFIKGADYVLDQPISIAGLSNLIIKGEGMGFTRLIGAGIIKNENTETSNLLIEDLTIDINNIANRNAVNLNGNLTHAILRRLELKNTNNRFLLHWGTENHPVNDLIVENCVFYDAGLTISADNAAGDQDKATNYTTTFRQNLFIKEYSIGGGMLTCGSCGNLLIDGNTFIDYTNKSYAAISLENYYGSTLDITVVNNKAYGDGMQVIGIGNSASGNSGKAVISNNLCQGIILKGFREGVIDSNIVASGMYGIYVYNSTTAIISNNIIHDTNIYDSPSYSDKGCIYGAYVARFTITNNLMYDTLSITPYGTRVSYSTTIWIHGNSYDGTFIYYNASDAGSNTNYIMHDNLVYGTYFEDATT